MSILKKGNRKLVMTGAKGGATTPIKCFKCGIKGHQSSKCIKDDRKCFKYGRKGHNANDYRVGSNVTCYNYDCVKRLNLKLFDMHGSMIIDTPIMGYVSTSFVCLSCTLSIFGRDFGIDLVCLPLDQIDVILGMNWFEYNHVYINCFDKTVIFLDFGVEKDLFLFAKQVNESEHDDVVLLALMATLDVCEKRVMGDLPIFRDFPEVFPDM
ncbi:uncharacterized protein LOC131648941 [Vicia villosa]|uniref:uncharacterized protein LOC131648941 n=1 Tax=Vicia villosa TaxID=3911 RepID=UPI00273AC1BA|nr:uncharacterized protein LOC131648941 [Vicia villosa]